MGAGDARAVTANFLQTRNGVLILFVSLQMIQAIQVLRFHLLELEKVIISSLFPLYFPLLPKYTKGRVENG